VRYRTLRRALPGALWAYLVAGFLAATAPGFEVFPFFCWFLFPVTPNVESRHELMVERLGGRTWDEPVSYQSLDLVDDPYAMDLWTTVQALGAAVEAADDAEVARLRRRLEANFLPAPSRWGVDRVTFDPLVRYRAGTIEDRARIATFTSSTGCAEIPWASAR
jgi:hypothetical protein